MHQRSNLQADSPAALLSWTPAMRGSALPVGWQLVPASAAGLPVPHAYNTGVLGFMGRIDEVVTP